MAERDATLSTAGGEPRAVLEVEDLYTYIATEGGVVRAVDGVSFTLRRGEILGIVGESGSGKSVTCRSIARLMPTPPAQSIGTVRCPDLAVGNILELGGGALQAIRGAHISMIFQDPMTSLNPVVRIGEQIAESVGAHQPGLGRAERHARAVELMRRVGIPSPERRARDYPHQFSGGMRQRVLIAIALASHPKILLADEPTTALDVIIQDQILSLLLELQRDFEMSMILVSHDMGVIAQMCDRIAVMYAGQIVELADTETLLTEPRHPYTRGLLASIPDAEETADELAAIAGAPPSLIDVPPGCRFAPRCPYATDACRAWDTELLQVADGHQARCLRHDELGAWGHDAAG